jgi:hypothetical protein
MSELSKHFGLSDQRRAQTCGNPAQIEKGRIIVANRCKIREGSVPIKAGQHILDRIRSIDPSDLQPQTGRQQEYLPTRGTQAVESCFKVGPGQQQGQAMVG